MTLNEMKKKVLGLIEELNPDSDLLTDDPDIATKINDVINQVMFELARMKKIPDYVALEVAAGDLIRFEDIANKSGHAVYQIDAVKGVMHELKASGTIIKVMETGALEVDYFRYPEVIIADTPDSYVFELSADALEIMPYGVAADLLKSDVSTRYGEVYANRYESMLQRLDPRYSMGSFYIDGGYDI